MGGKKDGRELITVIFSGHWVRERDLDREILLTMGGGEQWMKRFTFELHFRRRAITEEEILDLCKEGAMDVSVDLGLEYVYNKVNKTLIHAPVHCNATVTMVVPDNWPHWKHPFFVESLDEELTAMLRPIFGQTGWWLSDHSEVADYNP